MKVDGFWSLKKDPITWDFAMYLAIAKTHGITNINFDSTKLSSAKFHGGRTPPDVVAQLRFDNILKPLCELAGVSHSEGTEGFSHGFHAGDLNLVFDKKGWLWKFKPITDHGKRGYVTVTIRESFRNVARNSNRTEWDRVISKISKEKEVIVIEDCERKKALKPMPVSERMSLYAYADMNLGCSNGPMALLICSESPYLIFNMIPRLDESKIWENHTSLGGFPRGAQYKFRNARQKVVWKHDDYEHIMLEYRQSEELTA